MYSDGVQKNQITPLTGLRWVAALFVYLSHTITDDDLPQSLLQFSGNGYCGVTIFFILSAFILTVNYHNRLGIRDLFKYFIARAARILPIYYVILIFVLLEKNSDMDPFQVGHGYTSCSSRVGLPTQTCLWA